MKTITLGWMAALGLTGSVLGFAACSQPKTECQVGLAGTGYSYVAKYKLKSQPSAACMGAVKLGETFGMEFYHPATADKSTFDSNSTTIALGSDDFGFVVGSRDPDPNEENHPYALGKFSAATPDDKDICSVPTAAAEQNLAYFEDTVGLVPADTTCTTDEDCRADTQAPCMTTDDCDAYLGPGYVCGAAMTCLDPASGAVCEMGKCVAGCRGTDAMGMPAPNSCVAPNECASTDSTPGICKQDQTSIKYEWSNLKFYVTAAAQGTQFSGDLEYTQDGCTIEYTDIGMWPAIPCAEDAHCNPCADVDAGVTVGSGISPDFPTRCDTDLGYCVLTDAKDGKKDAESIPQILAKPIDCGAVN